MSVLQILLISSLDYYNLASYLLSYAICPFRMLLLTWLITAWCSLKWPPTTDVTTQTFIYRSGFCPILSMHADSELDNCPTLSSPCFSILLILSIPIPILYFSWAVWVYQYYQLTCPLNWRCWAASGGAAELGALALLDSQDRWLDRDCGLHYFAS